MDDLTYQVNGSLLSLSVSFCVCVSMYLIYIGEGWLCAQEGCSIVTLALRVRLAESLPTK